VRNIITKVPRYRHPDARFPVLCQSVADRIGPDIVEDLEEFPVFTENGGTAYSAKRTRLWCAEEYEHNRLYGWDNVEFYIVPDLEQNFGYSLLIPLQYYWGADETGSNGKKRVNEARSSGKKRADEPRSSGKKKANEPRSGAKKAR
jgi:hypothetical protein